MQRNFWEEKPSRRIKLMENALEKDPFLYHKKKNVISSRFNDSNEDDAQKINQELLFCQDENNKYINSYKNNIKQKSSTIETNAHNYINYMIKHKDKNSKKIVPTEPGPNNLDKNNEQNINININQGQDDKNIFPISFTPNKDLYDNNQNITLSNYRNNLLRLKNRNNNIFNGKNNSINELIIGNKLNGSISSNNIINKGMSFDENNLSSNNLNIISDNDIDMRNNNSINYFPRIQNLKGTDITDHNYYDRISRQLILQMNKNYMDYNQNILNKRYSPISPNKMLYVRNNNLALPPGHISNPKYYNLGESRLKSNPIVNPGNRAPIFNNYHNHRLKSEFI